MTETDLAAALAARDGDCRLSEHFTLGELVASEVAVTAGIDNWPVGAGAPIRAANLQRLARLVLEPLRALIKRPLRVHSGYRGPALNALVGSKPSSQHLLGLAADVSAAGLDMIELARIVQLKSAVPFDQLILEGQRPGLPGSGWVHVSIAAPDAAARHEVLTYDGHAFPPVYLPGLRALT